MSKQINIVTQLSLNLTFKWLLSKLLKPDEKSLIPGLYLIIVNNFKTIIILNGSLNPAHPIVVAQAKPQPKDQIRVVLLSGQLLYVGPDVHALHEALQEAVAYTYALHRVLKNTTQLLSV